MSPMLSHLLPCIVIYIVTYQVSSNDYLNNPILEGGFARRLSFLVSSPAS